MVLLPVISKGYKLDTSITFRWTVYPFNFTEYFKFYILMVTEEEKENNLKFNSAYRTL